MKTRLYDVAATLSSAMKVRLNLTSSLHAFVITHKGFTASEFSTFANILQRDLPGVMSLQLAPDGVVTYLTNIEDHKSAIGHDLFKDAARREVVEKSVRERSFIITGPISLIQGGQAVIARKPVFITQNGSGEEKFWGFATILIDINALIGDNRVESLGRDFDMAIRGKNGLGARGDVFVGEQATFDRALAVSNIQLPNASWQIAVADKKAASDSWLNHYPIYWVTAIGLAMVGSVFTFVIIDRPRHLHQHVRQATSDLVQEIAQRKEAEKKVRYVAHHDQLTGLANRSLFDELSKQALVSAKRDRHLAAVLFVDIDGFKAVNDNFGHFVGDHLLKLIAERLVSRLRESDIIARFGGDEFTLFLSEQHDLGGVETVAEEIVSALSEPFYVEESEVKVGASVGVAIYPEHGDTVDELIRKSDSAMYSAKNSGKNTYRLAEG